MMDKQQLLAFIQSLPDDLVVRDFDIREWQRHESSWTPTDRVTEYGRVHTRSVDNLLTMKLDFKANYSGEFWARLDMLDHVETAHNYHCTNPGTHGGLTCPSS